MLLNDPSYPAKGAILKHITCVPVVTKVSYLGLSRLAVFLIVQRHFFSRQLLAFPETPRIIRPLIGQIESALVGDALMWGSSFIQSTGAGVLGDTSVLLAECSAVSQARFLARAASVLDSPRVAHDGRDFISVTSSGVRAGNLEA